MDYHLLGKSGLRTARVALGTMTFGDDWGWGAPRDTCARLLDAYLDAGGNHVDTADFYTNGASETILGELMGDRRDRIVLATKYTLQSRSGDPNAAGNQRRHLVGSLEASLRRLRTDRIDLYWVHARDVLTPVDEVMRALDDQVRLGKVLYVGVSDWPAWEIAQATTLADLRGWTPFVGLQTQYSLAERASERDLLPMARALGLGVLAWSPLAAGLLSGKYAQPGATGRLADRVRDDERTAHLVRELGAVAGELDATSSQVALAWLLSRPGVTPLLGATGEAQLAENLASTELQLPDDALRRLDAASAVDMGFPHDFLASDQIRDVVYGDTRERLHPGRPGIELAGFAG